MESVADDGKFIMPLEDYIQNYSNTTFTIESNASIYKHNPVAFDFNNTKQAVFKFKLEKAIDCNKEGFAISCAQ